MYDSTPISYSNGTNREIVFLVPLNTTECSTHSYIQVYIIQYSVLYIVQSNTIL